MTDRSDHGPGFDAAFARGMTQRRMSRRGALKAGGAPLGALSMSQILAACGGDGTTSSAVAGPAVDFTAEPGPNVNFSNWPAVHRQGEGPRHGRPLLAVAREVRGRDRHRGHVQRRDQRQRASSSASCTPSLEAGQDTGRDIIVITNGRELNQILARGWATELDPALRPNFDANAADWARDPPYDAGNRFTMAVAVRASRASATTRSS